MKKTKMRKMKKKKAVTSKFITSIVMPNNLTTKNNLPKSQQAANKLAILKLRIKKLEAKKPYKNRRNSLLLEITALERSIWKKKQSIQALSLRKIPGHTEIKKKWQIRKQEIGHLLYKLAILRWTKLPQKRSLKYYMNWNNEFSQNLQLNILSNNRRKIYHLIERYKIKLKLKKKLKKKYNKLKALKKKIFSKRSTKSFKRFTKYKTKTKQHHNNITLRQIWLRRRYAWLKKKIASKSKKFANKLKKFENKSKKFTTKKNVFAHDFLKTYFGQHLLNAHKLNNNVRTTRWGCDIKYNPKASLYKLLLSVTGSGMRYAQKLTGINKRGWLYNNLTFPKRLPYNFNKKAARRIYPYKLYGRYWALKKESPWLDPIQVNRMLYSGFLTKNIRELKWKQKFTWIPNLQKKKPMWRKRNQLYARYTKLLFNYWAKGRIQKKKHARIKKVLSKILLPFYGNIKMEQFNKIKNKVRNKKVDKANLQLDYLESRLDVVVFRLNLAPNIIWARKLIKDGSVFVNSTTNGNAFEKMYAPLKKNVYPLKLRDPLNLYKKTVWSKFNTIHEDLMPEGELVLSSSKLRFLLEPMRNINYLTQPGDVILCAPSAMLNKHKTQNLLLTKIVPKHILTSSDMTETKKQIKKKTNLIKAFGSNTQKFSTVSIILFKPTYNDLDYKDRVQKSFMRWLSL